MDEREVLRYRLDVHAVDRDSQKTIVKVYGKGKRRGWT